jgi:hypothetical protein
MPPEGLEPSESQLFPDQQIRLSLSMISGGFQAFLIILLRFFLFDNFQVLYEVNVFLR